MKTLFDDDHDDDPAERQRVNDRIGGAILDFCRDHAGQQFHGKDLLAHVLAQVGEVAPDSPGRILRDLRRRRKISYRVVRRRDSLYELPGHGGNHAS